MIRRHKRKSKFQERLDKVQEMHKQLNEEKKLHSVSPEDPAHQSATLSAQPPEYNPDGEFNWVDVGEDLPPYYAPIHIWDGSTLYFNWSRVWSETLGVIYVNNQDDRVLTKITHWSAPNGLTYPKYEPLGKDDVKIYTRRDIKHIIGQLTRLIKRREGSNLPHIEYNTGVDDAIITLERLIKPKRTKKSGPDQIRNGY